MHDSHRNRRRRTLATPPAPASPFPYNPGSLLSVLDLTVEDVSRLLARATELEQMDPLVRDRILAKRRMALLFYESSTRTRTSFELAAKALGADTTLVSNLSSSIEKGESLKDTGLTLRALGAEAIILRHNSSGAAWLLEDSTRLPVINAGDGMHEHPTQALLDLRTICWRICDRASDRRSRRGRLWRGVTVIDCRRHSAQPRGALEHAAAAAAGRARAALRPEGTAAGAGGASGPGIEIERDFEAALRQSQAVMMLRIQAERLAGLQLDLDEYKAQLPAHRAAAGGACAQRAGAAPGTDHSRPGDHGGRRRRAAVGDPGASDERRGHSHGGGGAGADGRRQGGRA